MNMDIDTDSAGVRIPPPLVYLAGLGAGLGLDWLLGLPGTGLPVALRQGLAVLTFASGAGLLLWANGLFRRAGTDVKPWKTTTSIVTTGPYRFTRNPMYVGMALVLTGLALAADSWITLVMIAPVLLWVRTQVIAREESYLESRFGTSYRHYKAQVRRWL